MITDSSNIFNIIVPQNTRMTLADVEKIPTSLPCLMGWKDHGSRYLGITDYMINYSGLGPRDELLGKCDHEIERFDGFSDHFMSCDQFAMNVKPLNIIEKTVNAKNEMITVNAMKYPIYDASLDKVVGVFFCGIPIDNAVILPQQVNSTSPILLSGTHYVFDLPKKRIELTEKESGVLYYYLRGRTSKQIANALALSYRTVEDYINSIKNKLNFDSRSDIVDFVISLGLFDFVPRLNCYPIKSQ